MIGKKIRMERIIDRNSGKTVIIPMDHGVTSGSCDRVDQHARDDPFCSSRWS